MWQEGDDKGDGTADEQGGGGEMEGSSTTGPRWCFIRLGRATRRACKPQLLVEPQLTVKTHSIAATWRPPSIQRQTSNSYSFRRGKAPAGLHQPNSAGAERAVD
jgi:hypothetical protein